MIHIRIESLLWFVSGCVFQDDGYKYSRATMITVKVLFFSFQLEFQAKSNFTIFQYIRCSLEALEYFISMPSTNIKWKLRLL